jgi:RimJ/RimL family protein N-acetyltransferase
MNRLTIREPFYACAKEEWARWPAGPYLILSRATGHLIGGTGFAFEEPHQAATWYVLAKDACGRGYATEALGAIVIVLAATGSEPGT